LLYFVFEMLLFAVVEKHLPTMGVETCAVVEIMYSMRTAYEITGDIMFYDRLERIAFNALPLTTAQDFSGNCYYHMINQITLSSKDGYGPPFTCCTGNVHQGWPKFIMSGVQTKHGLGSSAIVVSGYSPYTATLGDGTTVQIGGQYPFADNVTLAVKRAKAGAAWTLTLRIPCWADSALVIVEGKPPVAATPCTMFAVPSNLLDAGTADFAAAISFEHNIKILWDKWSGGASKVRNASTTATTSIVTSASGRMHHSDENSADANTTEHAMANDTLQPRGQANLGAVEIHRGPLVFTFPVPGGPPHCRPPIASLPVNLSHPPPISLSSSSLSLPPSLMQPGIVNTTVLNETSFGMVHKTSVKIDTTKPYLYALTDPNASDAFSWGGFNEVEGVPFDRTRPLATITTKARQVTANSGNSGKTNYAKGAIPASPVPPAECNGSAVEEITLVPLGHSYLRFTVLPWLAATGAEGGAQGSAP
jgi:hypothetical protein